MDNNENQKAQDALKTLNKIKKGLKIFAYILMLAIFGISLLIVHQQELYIEQLNQKLIGIEKQVGAQSDQYKDLENKVRKELKSKDNK